MRVLYLMNILTIKIEIFFKLNILLLCKHDPHKYANQVRSSKFHELLRDQNLKKQLTKFVY